MRTLKLMVATLIVVVLRVTYLNAQARQTMSNSAASSLHADPHRQGNPCSHLILLLDQIREAVDPRHPLRGRFRFTG